MAIPGAPQDVVVAADRLWQAALARVRNWAGERLASEQQAVQAAKVQLSQAQSAFANERIELERVMRGAQAKQQDLTERVAEFRQELSGRLAEIQDLKIERLLMIDGT